VRLDIRRIQGIKSGENDIGNRTRVKVVKNKVSPPFKEAEFDIMYAEGISKVGDILDIGTLMELIEKRGAFFRYKDQLIGQGREAAKEYLKQNPAMAFEIEQSIRAGAGLPTLEAPLPAVAAAAETPAAAPTTEDAPKKRRSKNNPAPAPEASSE